ncbi:MAG: C10 family peptidase [Desulfobacula sp.]|jgi:hypothetical protein
MKQYFRFNTLTIITLLITVTLFITGTNSFSAPIEESEALDVADIWYARELNSSRIKLEAAARADKLNNITDRQVFYLVDGGELLDSAPKDKPVLAYVINYNPSGFVVVAGDDRILPIMAFDAGTAFRWDDPDRNFLRHFLQKNIPARWQHLQAKTRSTSVVEKHPMWNYLRAKKAEGKSPDTVSPDEVPMDTLQWTTANWNQGWPYNTTVLANNGNINDIPTGCTATAMAIKMRYHSWPATGNGSHSYNDNKGSVQFSHAVNFGAQSYDWASMPTTNLSAANTQVANLMYHCGVAVDMDYEVGGSGAWLSLTAMDTNYRYKGTIDLRSNHTAPMMESILAGLPVILSSSNHTVVADGYRDDQSPYFHINAGWGGSSNGWYNLDLIPGDNTVLRSYPYSSPSNYIYANLTWGGVETGTLQNPYNTISEGVYATPDNGQLWIKGGSYGGPGNAPVLFSRAMTIHPYQGSVTIGQ